MLEILKSEKFILPIVYIVIGIVLLRVVNMLLKRLVRISMLIRRRRQLYL